MEPEDNFKTYTKLKNVCTNIIRTPKDTQKIMELKSILQYSSQSFVKAVQPTVLSTFYPILKTISDNKSSFSITEKQIFVDTIKELLDKSVINKLGLFYNIYAFLLFEVYDHVHHIVLQISEEYKLSIIKCMTSLANSVSYDLIPTLYTKEAAPKLCQMLYVAVELAKTERMRQLRIAAIDAIMAIARVLNDDDFGDLVVRNQVSDIFLFFLPGIASGLRQIALVDDKVGHKIPQNALKAWGRIVTLLMQDYTTSDEKQNLSDVLNNLNANATFSTKPKKWKNEGDLKDYIQNSKKTPEWYKETDRNLSTFIVDFSKLSYHRHFKIRLELATMCTLLIENCITTMPVSVSHAVEIVISLSEDELTEVSYKCKVTLNNLSKRFSSNDLQVLLEYLEEGFYNGVNKLPRKFNGFDEKEQLAGLNLLIGYINVFGSHKLLQILLSAAHLNKLLSTLIHISELEKCEVGFLENQTSIQEIDCPSQVQKAWKKFRYFRETSVMHKLENLCKSLAMVNTAYLVTDFLLDIFHNDPEHKKEATFLLNEFLSGVENNTQNYEVVKNVLSCYIDITNWYVPLTVGVDQDGYEHDLAEIQNNVTQVCLLIEGIGKFSVVLQKDFKHCLFKILFLLLERAGNSNSLIQATSLQAINNVIGACGYTNITELINRNIDYFTFQVERKLNRMENNEAALNVLGVVLKHSSMDVLSSVSFTINEILMQSCDRFKEKHINSFLQLFKTFLQCLHRWLNIQIVDEPLKSRLEKQHEVEGFKVSGIEYNENFSDDIMGKSAEEMCKEDMEKPETCLLDEEDEIGYEKPDPPMHVKLTVSILKRSLHFLASKDIQRKLLTIEILSLGLELIRDWEDELLPIVHQVWSPLAQRFKETNEPLIVNYSFQLLMVLARLSKDFIRSRTSKEALPYILSLLDNLAKNSYLQDKGSSYRYTQAYKLQLKILNDLARLIAYLDLSQECINSVMHTVIQYIDERQPIPLQVAALEFYRILALYDYPLVEKEVKSLSQSANKKYEKNLLELCKILK